MLNNAAAAVVALAVIAAAAPAFAWGAGAPDNYYNQTVQGPSGYYNYAPEALTKQTPRVVHNRKHEVR